MYSYQAKFNLQSAKPWFDRWKEGYFSLFTFLEYCSDTHHAFLTKKATVLRISNQIDNIVCDSIYLHKFNPKLNGKKISTPLDVLSYLCEAIIKLIVLRG